MGQGWALLIESQAPQRRRLRALLTAAGRTAVVEASDALDGVRQAVCLRPECVIVDEAMMDRNGLALGRLIHDLVPHCAVILLVEGSTARDPPPYEEGIAARVDKGAGMRELPLVLGRLLEGPPAPDRPR